MEEAGILAEIARAPGFMQDELLVCLFLGLLVLIRATVSFFLDREIHTIRRELDP